MPNASQEESRAELSERIETLRREVQFLVLQGGEQGRYEFKRAVSLRRENLAERLAFIKLVQAVANSEIQKEKCIVIGADPKEKTFFAVDNDNEFDAANLSKILSAYLEPLPSFESFRVSSDKGEPFVLIVLASDQPRPIVIIKQGHCENGKTRLEVGDIFLKRNTDTVRAVRADIDAMYSRRTEEEVENRARKRLKHLLEIQPQAVAPRDAATSSLVPTRRLLLGPKNELKVYSEDLIATDDFRRLKMLLELAREQMVERWQASTESFRQIEVQEDAYRDEFFPSLDATVELALQIVKYDAGATWLKPLVEILVEAFDSGRSLARLAGALPVRSSLPWWQPSFDVFLGLKTIATYAIKRGRLGYLATVLPIIVRRLSLVDNSRARTPILFWPFRGVENPKFTKGRAQRFWEDRISWTWGGYFASSQDFLDVTSQLEFLLEFNSYFGGNTPGDDHLSAWLKANMEGVDFGYLPDLFADELQGTAPMADILYEAVASGTQNFPPHLAVDHRIIDEAFRGKNVATRLNIYAAFLSNTLKERAEVRRQFYGFWGYTWTWEGPVGELLNNTRKTREERNGGWPTRLTASIIRVGCHRAFQSHALPAVWQRSLPHLPLLSTTHSVPLRSRPSASSKTSWKRCGRVPHLAVLWRGGRTR